MQSSLLNLAPLIVAIFVMAQVSTPCSGQTTAASYADAQNPLGPQGPGKLDDIWSLDKSSGFVGVRIPISTTPRTGRGPAIPYILQYNSGSTAVLSSPYTFVVANTSGSTYAVSVFEWLAKSAESSEGGPVGPWVSIYGPSMFIQTQTATSSNIAGSTTCHSQGPYLFSDSNGQEHDLNLGVFWDAGGSGPPCTLISAISTNGHTTDGSALSANIDNFWTRPPGNLQPVLDASGTSTTVPHHGSATKIIDSNGNIAQTASGVWQDSLGRTIATAPFGLGAQDISSNGSYAITTTGPGQVSEQYSVNVGTISPTWSFSLPHPTSAEAYVSGSNQSTITSALKGSTLKLVTELDLPNLTHYSFTYDPTYGTLSYIYFPTGGYVHFSWGIRNIGTRSASGTYVNVEAQSTIVAKDVYISDGSSEKHWSYTYTDMDLTSGALKTTETAPDGTVTSYTYMPYYVSQLTNGSKPIYLETLRTISSGGLMKESIATSYAQIPYPTQVATTLYDGTSPLQSQIAYSYDAYGNPIEKDESDFYVCTGKPCSVPSTPSGGWKRKTFATLQYASASSWVTAHIVNKPSQVLVTDGNSSPLALTIYKYDETSVGGSAGYINHDDINYGVASALPRGNLTTESHCATFSSATAVTASTAGGACAEWSTTTHTYDLAGQVLSTTDPNGRTSTYSYADQYVDTSLSSQSDGYVTTVTNAAGLQDHYSYYYSSGQIESHTDPNSQLTKFVYNDPGDMSRLTETQYPDGGDVKIVYQDSTPSITVTTATGETAGPVVRKTIFDGLGRAKRSQLNSDLQGVDYTDTTYDDIGRVQSVSNPYRTTSDATYGITSYLYDALGRMQYKCNQDSSAGSGPCTSTSSSRQTWTYSGNTTTFTDENGNSWQRTSDALGRLIQVVEPNLAKTYYIYDALGNLTCTAQDGGGGGAFTSCTAAPASWRPRSFSYDSLSRLTTSSNPETGVTGYSYDANGNVLTRIDARGVVTHYSYDALNRLLSKTYTNSPAGTLSSCYQYDTAGNGVGHLGAEWTQAVSCSSAPPSNYQSLRKYGKYDVMGRALTEQQCTAGYCTSTSVPSQPTSNCSALTSAVGLQYCYDLAGNLLAYSNGVTTSAAGSFPQQALLFSQTFDSAGRLASVGSSWSDATHPRTLFSTPTYEPFGTLQSGQLGGHLGVTRSYDNRLRVTGQSAAQQ